MTMSRTYATLAASLSLLCACPAFGFGFGGSMEQIRTMERDLLKQAQETASRAAEERAALRVNQPEQSRVDTMKSPVASNPPAVGDDFLELNELTIRQAPAIGDWSPRGYYPFIYTVSDLTRRAGLLYLDGETYHLSSLDGVTPEAAVQVVECGRRSDFVPRKGYVNAEDFYGDGVTGYEQDDHPCAIARKLEYQWHRGLINGADYWFSYDEHGVPQCYSLDQSTCVETSEMTAQWVENVIAFWWPSNTSQDGDQHVLDLLHSPSYRDSHNLNDEPALLVAARPFVCSEGLLANPDHWCGKFGRLDASNRERTRNYILDGSSTRHVVILVNQWERYHRVRLHEEYSPRIREMGNRIDELQEGLRDCVARIGIHDPYDMSKGNDYCTKTFQNPRDDLIDAQDALRSEFLAEWKKMREKAAELRYAEAHEIHEALAGDDSDFAALLALESQELAELDALQEHYRKEAANRKSEYIEAMKQEMIDLNGGEVEVYDNDVTRELGYIFEFVEDPSAKNLRQVLTGAVTLGEDAVDEGVQFVFDEAAAAQRLEQTAENIASILEEFISGDAVTAMEDFIEAFYRENGDEMVDTARALGLYQESGDNAPIMQLGYQSVMDIKATAPLTGGGRAMYDPWLDDSRQASLFRDKFTLPEGVDETHLARLEEPAALTSPDATTVHEEAQFGFSRDNVRNVANASRFVNDIFKIFSHSMGQEFVDTVAGYETTTASEASEIRHGRLVRQLYEVISSPEYEDFRMPRWLGANDLGAHPSGLIYDDDDAVIVMNADLVGDDMGPGDFTELYLEELGHLVNWWRCRLYDIPAGLCEVDGDVGARFRDAVLLDPAHYRQSVAADFHLTGAGEMVADPTSGPQKPSSDSGGGSALPFTGSASTSGESPASAPPRTLSPPPTPGTPVTFPTNHILHQPMLPRPATMPALTTKQEIDSDDSRGAVPAADGKSGFAAAISALPAHTRREPRLVRFTSGEFGKFEGFPNYYTWQPLGGGTFDNMLRLAVGIRDMPVISNHFSLDVIVGGFRPAMRDDPWAEPADRYCENDEEKDCNMPTIWLNLSLRDLIDADLSSTSFSEDSFGETDMIDAEVYVYRRHGVKLPFQLRSVDDTKVKFMDGFTLFYKKIGIGLEGRFSWPGFKQYVRKPALPSNGVSVAAKSRLTISRGALGSAIEVQVPAKEKEELLGLIFADILANAVGCGIATVGVLAAGEPAPVTACHAGADIAETLETFTVPWLFDHAEILDTGGAFFGVDLDLGVSTENIQFFPDDFNAFDLTAPRVVFRPLFDWSFWSAKIKEGEWRLADPEVAN